MELVVVARRRQPADHGHVLPEPPRREMLWLGCLLVSSSRASNPGFPSVLALADTARIRTEEKHIIPAIQLYQLQNLQA